jgi:regulator of replication initiation timing
MLAPRRNQDQLTEQVSKSMAEMSEQTQGLTDMMKQLMDSFNDLKVNQIEMRDALREVQSRTEAVEAHARSSDARRPRQQIRWQRHHSLDLQPRRRWGNKERDFKISALQISSGVTPLVSLGYQ